MPSAGAFVSFRIAPAVYADGAANVSLRPARDDDGTPVHTPFDGGRLTQAVGGVKIGVRADGYGVFGKLRVGVNSHSAAFAGHTESGVAQTRRTALAVDTGAVFERYIGNHIVGRFDGGDTISVFHPVMLRDEPDNIQRPAEGATHSLQMTFAFGWRF